MYTRAYSSETGITLGLVDVSQLKGCWVTLVVGGLLVAYGEL